VLPFANLGGDPEQEYFVDAITDDLTTDLSRISGSFVIARSTAFTYKNRPVDVRQIGRELGVRYVLEGSVRAGSDDVRVNVQLVDAESGAHLWADRFATDPTNVTEAQSRLAEAQSELETAIALDPNNTSALHQVGLTLMWFGQPQEAITCVEKGIRLSPHDPIAFAYSVLGMCYLLLGQVERAIGPLRKARAANPRALFHSYELGSRA
jgi:TolB-like protein